MGRCTAPGHKQPIIEQYCTNIIVCRLDLVNTLCHKDKLAYQSDGSIDDFGKPLTDGTEFSKERKVQFSLNT